MPLPANTIPKQRTPGYLLRLTFLGGVVTPWINATLEETLEVSEETAASSITPQRVTDMHDASFELEFFNGNVLNNANVLVDTGIVSMDIAMIDGSNATLLPANFLTLFPVATWKIVKKTYKQDRKSGRITISCTPGHLDLSPTTVS